MRSISEFITESTSVTFDNNDNLVKAYAECAGALALAECYAEQSSIMEFASEYNINSLRIVQESEGKENIFKRAGGAMKNAWRKFISWLKSIVRKVKEFFAGKKAESISNTLESVDQTAEITMDVKILYPMAIVSVVNDLIDNLKDTSNFTSEAGAEFEKSAKEAEQIVAGTVSINEILKDEAINIQGRKDGRIVMTVGQFRKLIKEVGGVKMSSKIETLNKKIDSISGKFEKMIDTSNAINDQWDDADWDKAEASNNKGMSQRNAAESMRKFMNSLTRVYDASMQAYNRIKDDVIAQIKKSKPSDFDKKTELGSAQDIKEYYV